MAIEIVTGDQVWYRDCDRRSDMCGLHYTICDQKCDCDRTSISGVCHKSTSARPSGESDTWNAMSKIWDRDSVVGFVRLT